MSIFRFFHSRKQKGGAQDEKPEPQPQPLRIEGIAPAPLTPEPDDAELAAQALLEILCDQHPTPAPPLKGAGSGYRTGKRKDKADAAPLPSRGGAGVGSVTPPVAPRTAAYYRHLSDRIRQAREGQRLRVVRFLAFVEQELKKSDLPAHGPGSLGLLEAELLKRFDIVEREGGDLKTRWQHALATVTVRLMQADGPTFADDDTEE